MSNALQALGQDCDPLIRVAQDEKFGDYQSNVAMGLAKQLGRPPRDVAQAIIEQLTIGDVCETPEIAGPGFINLRLKPEFLAGRLAAIPPAGTPQGDRLGIDRTESPQTVVVDLSSPNLAKEMHVGHLRSTVIGDCVARILEYEGHTVIRENHVGDWGTQFGMLVAYLHATQPDIADHPDDLVISDLESFYVQAKARFDTDDAFKREARDSVVKLQRGDPLTRRIWKAFCDESLRHCHEIYARLDVALIDRGESFYTDLMDEVIRRLERIRDERNDGLVAESEGALCIFLDGFKTRDGEPLPMIVRKSDGGYNYATSDLATLIHRVESLGAKRIVYVVGLPQKQHFEMLFAAARAVGFVPPDVRLEHLGFGSVLSASGQPFKTREGGTVKLKSLLDTAIDRARNVIDEPLADVEADDTIGESAQQRPQRLFSESEAHMIAVTVGMAAVKYFDLAHALQSDYKFDLDTILAMDGNTAPYMLYAYARIRSIARKAGVEFAAIPQDVPIVLEHPAEVALGRKLLQFAETLQAVGTDLRPNVVTDYLYELARVFSRFYDKRLGVRVIDATPDSLRLSRLRLCDLTARTLKLGLYLLGIETLEKM